MTRSILRRAYVPAIAVLLLAGGVTLLGQRGARTSVSRGGGGRSFSGGDFNRSAGSANRSFSGGDVNRSAGSVNRSFSGTDVNRNFNSANVNRNFNNVNVNRNFNSVNVNRDVDVDGGRWGGWGDACCYHPAAAAAAVTAAAVTTAAVVGSSVHTLPPACSAVSVDGVVYQQCGSTWYQPQFAGTSVNYVVVNPPQ